MNKKVSKSSKRSKKINSNSVFSVWNHGSADGRYFYQEISSTIDKLRQSVLMPADVNGGDGRNGGGRGGLVAVGGGDCGCVGGSSGGGEDCVFGSDCGDCDYAGGPSGGIVIGGCGGDYCAGCSRSGVGDSVIGGGDCGCGGGGSVIGDGGGERLYNPTKRVRWAERFICAKRFVSRSLSVCVYPAAADWFASYRDCLGAVSHYFICAKRSAWRDSCLASVAGRGREVHRWRGKPGCGL